METAIMGLYRVLGVGGVGLGGVVFRVWGLGFGSFPKLGVPYWGSPYKDYSILWSLLGSPYFRKLPFGGVGGIAVKDWGFGSRVWLGFRASPSPPPIMNTKKGNGFAHHGRKLGSFCKALKP